MRCDESVYRAKRHATDADHGAVTARRRRRVLAEAVDDEVSGLAVVRVDVRADAEPGAERLVRDAAGQLEEVPGHLVERRGALPDARVRRTDGLRHATAQPAPGREVRVVVDGALPERDR